MSAFREYGADTPAKSGYEMAVGIFDRLFRTKHAASVADAGRPVAPDLPAPAKIESYELTDCVGVLRLASGGQVAFGRSACDGFEPAEGVGVILEELAPNPRRLRAKVIKLDPSDGDYDRLLEAHAERARAEAELLTVRRLLLQPISACSSWRLACVLAKTERREDTEIALDGIRSELERRGRDAATIAEMLAVVAWAIDVINPRDGGTAGSSGAVHQVVGDTDDLLLAVEIAGRTGVSPPADLLRIRELVQRLDE